MFRWIICSECSMIHWNIFLPHYSVTRGVIMISYFRPVCTCTAYFQCTTMKYNVYGQPAVYRYVRKISVCTDHRFGGAASPKHQRCSGCMGCRSCVAHINRGFVFTRRKFWPSMAVRSYRYAGHDWSSITNTFLCVDRWAQQWSMAHIMILESR
jgi:hypothetical protein